MTPLDEVLGNSPGIQAVRATLMRVLSLGARRQRMPPLLILGDTGTGKGLLARVLHRAGPRASAPLVEVNCAAIPEALLEAELFGFERGAFTGAQQAKPGLFQTAHGGTLFLDEIGLLPIGVQGKLLKVLEDRTVRRLGSMRSEPADVALVAATSENLPAATQAGRFRKDLYHRLSVVVMPLPPLAERGSDILLLAEHFLARACADYGVGAKTLTPEARVALLGYPWPGNIRELGNVMERVALLNDAPNVTVDMLGLPPSSTGAPAAPLPELVPMGTRRGRARRPADRAAVLAAFEATGGNIAQTAARLGMPRGTLRYQLEKLGIQSRSPGSPPISAESEPDVGQRRPIRPDAPLQWTPRRLTFLRGVLTPPPDREVGPAAAATLAVLADKVASFGGRVEEQGPRDLIAVFGLEPIEDAPRRAAHTALALQREAARAQPSPAPPLHLTLAIDVATALVSETREPILIDLETKQAAYAGLEALVAAAEPGAILVGSGAVSPLARRFTLRPCGASTPPGAVRLEGLTRTELAPGGVLTGFVGRQPELVLLQSRLELAEQGHGQVVGIVGEPGIGKSRLLFEFHQRCLGLTILRGACVSYGSAIPYLPILGVLRDACGLTGTEPSVALEAQVRARCEAAGLGNESSLRILRLFRSTEAPATPPEPPELVRSDTFEAVRRLVFASARTGHPVVVSVEDVHWIDATSEELLGSLAEALAGTAVLLVTTYRAGYRSPWMNSSYATQVALPPLSPDDSREVVHAIFQGRPVPEPVTEQVLARAEGNPFFLEELSRVAFVPGAPAMPETVQDVLQARIDRLPDGPRRLLHTAAVIGREVPKALLQATAQMTESVGGVSELTNLEFLRELSALELIHEQRYPDQTYVFKHALTQDVAYASMSVRRRNDLHRIVGLAMEELYADRLPEHYERLAHHFSRAEDWERSLGYLVQAAQKATHAFAMREALMLYDDARGVALRLGDTATATLGAIHTARADLLFGMGDWSRSRAAAEARLDLSRSTGDATATAGALVQIANANMWAEDFPGALDRSREAIEIAESVNARAELAGGLHIRGFVRMAGGDLEKAETDLRGALASVEGTEDVVRHGLILQDLALVHGWRGQYRETVTLCRQALDIVRPRPIVQLLLWDLFTKGIAFCDLGEYDAAFEALTELMTLSERSGSNPVLTRAANTLGWLHIECGDFVRGIELSEHSYDLTIHGSRALHATGHERRAFIRDNESDAFLALGDLSQADEALREVRHIVEHPPPSRWATWRYTTHYYASLGQLALARGDADQARRCADQCLELAVPAPSRKYESWAWRIKGESASMRHAWKEADESLQRALTVAEAIHHPRHTWLGQLALGRLRASEGRRDDARRLYQAAWAIVVMVRARTHNPSLRSGLERTPLTRELEELAHQ